MSRASYLLKKYGITERDYAEILSKQEGCCAVCGKHNSKFKAKLAIDHEHSSGEIRGLLCAYCNRRIVGRHRKGVGDVLLYNAWKYLNKEYTGWIVPPKRKKRRARKSSRKKRTLL